MALRFGGEWAGVGFDYDLQVWHRDGIIFDCGHAAPEARPGLPMCCNSRRYAGLSLVEASALESKRLDATVGGPLWKRAQS